MYHKAYGIIETLAPLHVGASAGEETGNLNLIFRDQFTQTGIIPGSSIRGRFRADMRNQDLELTRECYGHEAIENQPNSTKEASVKFEYASLVWLPVFCPGQPIVWVSCPRLLKRYKQITGITLDVPNPETVELVNHRNVLFFNLGFIDNLEAVDNLHQWLPPHEYLLDTPKNFLIVGDSDIGIIHEMALYRQSRVRLKTGEKMVDGKGFFGVEALPEGSIFVFPVAIKEQDNENGFWTMALSDNQWNESLYAPLNTKIYTKELYFGGLESIGFGRCNTTLTGSYFQQEEV